MADHEPRRRRRALLTDIEICMQILKAAHDSVWAGHIPHALHSLDAAAQIVPLLAAMGRIIEREGGQ